MRKEIFVYMLFVLLLITCSTEPENNDPQITLTPLDRSVTEAFINVSMSKVESGDTILIKRDEVTVIKFKSFSGDTTVIDTGLTQSATYSYAAKIKGRNTGSNKIEIETMAPTSHEFTWRTWKIGDTPTSGLFDVMINNENDIWAVGAVYLNDLLGNPESLPYNAFHWDGKDWEKKKITVEYHGKQTDSPILGISLLNSGEIVFADGAPYMPVQNGWELIHYWDRGILTENDGYTPNVWGTAINNLYFAGLTGTIVHYNGAEWKKIESGGYAGNTGYMGIWFGCILCIFKQDCTRENKRIENKPGRNGRNYI